MLFSPIKVGSKTVENRIVVTAHGTNFGRRPDSIITDVYQKPYAADVKFTPNTIVTKYDGRNVTVKNPFSGKEDTNGK